MWSRQNAFLAFSLAAIFVIAWLLQDQQVLNWDVSQLLQSTKRMLEGGTYSQDFFMPNPPLIMYLYTPPVLFAQYFQLSLPIVFRAYIFLLAIPSLLFCLTLTKTIFSQEDSLLRNAFIIALASVYLIVPCFLLGQRDCLLVIFTMPYLLLVTNRLQGNTFSPSYAFAVGLFAALGFSIKPHFVILLVLTELYFSFAKRSLFAWVRIEVLTIIGFMLLHIMTTYLFFPDYFTVIIPFLMENYITSVTQPWHSLFINTRMVVCGLAAIFWFLQYKSSPYKILSTILLVAMTAFVITNVSQRSTFLYHAVPALSVALLILVLNYLIFVTKNIPSKYIMLLFVAVTLFVLYWSMNSVWTIYYFNPRVFYAFLAVLYLTLLGCAFGFKQYWKLIIWTGAIIGFGLLTNFFIKQSDWYSYTFIFTICAMLLLFSLFLARSYKKYGHYLFSAIAGMVIFILPVFILALMGDVGIIYKRNLLIPLMAFMRTQPPHQSLYSLSILGSLSAPLVDYVDASLAERFDCLWMVRGSARTYLPGNEKSLRTFIKNSNDKYSYMNMIVEDFKFKKPDLVLVDARDVNMDTGEVFFYFDFISYFSENLAFKEEWKKYRYLTTIELGEARKQIHIYKRIEQKESK